MIKTPCDAVKRPDGTYARCPHFQRCKSEQLACDSFRRYLQDGVVRTRTCEPSRKQFELIRKDESPPTPKIPLSKRPAAADAEFEKLLRKGRDLTLLTIARCIVGIVGPKKARNDARMLAEKAIRAGKAFRPERGVIRPIARGNRDVRNKE